MRKSRPSPSLIVSIIALVVACGGTATAASVMIKNSSQVKAGVLSGSDLHAKTIKNAQLATSGVDSRVLKDGSVAANDLSAALKGSFAAPGLNAIESVRRDGPTVPNGGQATVATLKQLAPGTYVIFAKTTQSPQITDQGLGEVLKEPKTGGGHCVLDAGGDSDDARTPIASPFAQTPSTMNLQITRTIGAPSDIKVNCDANIGWKATDTSIIALKLAGTTRIDTTG